MKETRPKTTEQPQEMTYAEYLVQKIEKRKLARVANKQQTTSIEQKAVEVPQGPLLKEDIEGYTEGLNGVVFNDFIQSSKTLKKVNRTNEYRTTSGHITIAKTPEIDTGELEILGVTVPEKQCLFVLVELFKRKGKQKEFSFVLDEYMKIRQLKDKKETKKQIKILLNSLASYTIYFDDETNGDYTTAGAKHVLEWEYDEKSRNGYVIEYGGAFYKALLTSQKTLYPDSLLTMNTSQKPLAFELLALLSIHKRRNVDTNEFYTTLSMGLIFEKCRTLPRLEDVDKKYYKRQIIEAIHTALIEYFSDDDIFFLTGDKAKAIPISKIPNDKDFISKLLLQVRWSDFPEHVYDSIKQHRADSRKASKKQPKRKPRKQPQ